MAFNPASISGGGGGIKTGDAKSGLTKGFTFDNGIVFGSQNKNNVEAGNGGDLVKTLRNNHLVHVAFGGLAVIGYMFLKRKKVF